MGYPEKVEDVIAQARADGAPQNAIGYEPSDDLWLTVDDIEFPNLAKRVEELVSLAKEEK